MSKRELVDSYVAGRISRRMFVRGLLTAGVTITAAVAYADQLAVGAPTSRARQATDLYPDLYSQPQVAPATAIPSNPRRFTG
jgi:hypothetical protein